MPLFLEPGDEILGGSATLILNSAARMSFRIPPQKVSDKRQITNWSAFYRATENARWGAGVCRNGKARLAPSFTPHPLPQAEREKNHPVLRVVASLKGGVNESGRLDTRRAPAIIIGFPWCRTPEEIAIVEGAGKW